MSFRPMRLNRRFAKMKLTMKRRNLVSFLMLLLLSSCGLEAVTEPHQVDVANEPTAVPTTAPIDRQTYTVERGDVIKEIGLTGQVVPETELALGFVLAGAVEEVLIERGDSVAEGDVIARLNSEDVSRQLTLAQSALEVVTARLEAVQNQVANNRRRAEIGLEQLQLRRDFLQTAAGESPTPQQQLDLDLLSLEIELAEITLSELASDIDPALQADVDQAQLRVDELNGLLADGSLVAPFSGVATRILVDAGDVVNAEDTAVILANLDQLVVRSFVNDDDLAEMQEGQPVIVALADSPDDPIEMVVQALPPPFGSGERLEENTAVFAPTAPLDLESGDRVTVRLVVAEQNDTLWLPTAALREFRGRYFVVVQQEAAQQRVDVEIGLEAEDRVEVLDGVGEGDTVVGP